MNSVTRTLFEQLKLELWRVTLFSEYIIYKVLQANLSIFGDDVNIFFCHILGQGIPTQTAQVPCEAHCVFLWVGRVYYAVSYLVVSHLKWKGNKQIYQCSWKMEVIIFGCVPPNFNHPQFQWGEEVWAMGCVGWGWKKDKFVMHKTFCTFLIQQGTWLCCVFQQVFLSQAHKCPQTEHPKTIKPGFIFSQTTIQEVPFF